MTRRTVGDEPGKFLVLLGFAGEVLRPMSLWVIISGTVTHRKANIQRVLRGPDDLRGDTVRHLT
jgi:hypothetical protein